MTLQQEWHRAQAEALLLLSKSGGASAHSEWMDYCVPQLLGYGKDQDVAVAACLNMWRDTWEATHPEGTNDPGPPRPEKLARWRELIKTWNEADHPRVPAGNPDGGEFVGDNSGGGADIPDASLHPDVVDVGGDAWNKDTARRLEREYQAAKAKLEAAVTNLSEGTEPPDEDEDFVAGVPEEWDDLSEHDKEHAQELYYEYKLNVYIQNEHDNWVNNGGQLDESKANLSSDSVWLEEELKNWMTGKSDDIPGEGPGEPFTDLKYPFTADQLVGATLLDYESDGEGGGSLKVKFDNDFLDLVPITDPNQLTLPGVEPVKNSDLLTKEMRIELTVMIKGKFNEKAEENANDISPPLELADQAKEYMKDTWEEGMTDGEKWNFVKHDTDIINDKEGQPDIPETAPAPGLPKFYDPLNDTSGEDYKKTQWLARNLSVARAVEVIAERGIKMKPGVNPLTAIRRVDSELWSGWKASSTSAEGRLLQVATADELGGRLNPKTGHGGKVELDKEAIRREADKDYEGIGGYAAVKAYVRAKWETTQYLLDRAGINELKLYRGIALELDTLAQAEREKMLIEMRQMVEGHAKVPVNVVRNGAASTTTNPNIANGWSQSSTRLVLRISAPRTAAVSIPAYGINVKSEQEVVIAGTAWKGWDSWLGSAPDFEKVKLAA